MKKRCALSVRARRRERERRNKRSSIWYHSRGIIHLFVDEKDMCSFRQGQTKRERERERRNKRCASEVADRRRAIARGRRTRTSENEKKQRVEEQQG
jgi:hypothetical protein